MLKVSVINFDLKAKKASVLVSVPKRVFKKDLIHDCSQEEVCNAAVNALLEESKEIVGCEFVSKPPHLNNRYTDSIREFTLEAKLLTKKEANQSSKSRPSSSSSSPKSKSKSSSSS